MRLGDVLWGIVTIPRAEMENPPTIDLYEWARREEDQMWADILADFRRRVAALDQ